MRWMNPSSETIKVDYTIKDSYYGFSSSSGLAEMAVCMYDASEDNVNILFGDSVHASDNYFDGFTLENIIVEPGDSIFVTTHQVSGGGWSNIIVNPTITVVPEPATLSLLAFGGLALLRKRK